MSFISYTSGIPNPANNPSVDVTTMQTNSTALATIWTQDHFGFRNNAGGYHKFVHLKNTAAPGGLGANADAVFYANTASGQSWPFWQNALGSFQIIGNQSIAASGYTGVGGVIIQWGSVNSPGGGPSAVSFPLTFPSAVFSIQLTPRNDGSHSAFTYYIDGAPTTSGFTYRGSTSGSNTLYWIAIGN